MLSPNVIVSLTTDISLLIRTLTISAVSAQMIGSIIIEQHALNGNNKKCQVIKEEHREEKSYDENLKLCQAMLHTYVEYRCYLVLNFLKL